MSEVVAKAKPFNSTKFMSEFDDLTEQLFGSGDRFRFYSRKEWDVERGESIGTNALLNCVIEESTWYYVLNGHFSDVHNAYKKLQELEKKYGVYHELGYAWSMHWYPA